MTPTTRPSSSTRTTSFDLRSARRHRGRWGPLPVWPQLFGGQCGAARGGLAHRQPLADAKRTPPGCAHCADSCARERSTILRRDRVGRLSHPTGQAVIVALRRAQRPVWAPGVRILGRSPIIRRRSRTSSIVDRADRGPVGWPNPREDDRPTGVLGYAVSRAAQPQPRSPSSSMPSTTGCRQGRASRRWAS